MVISARWLRWGLNLWPPYLFSGIHVERLDQDYRYARVRLSLRFYNRNYVGTHYGGNLFSMTDPFYMLMLLHRLGRDFIVWDLKACIRFRAPGRSHVWAEFHLPDERVEAIRAQALTEGRANPSFHIEIKDASGTLIAEVDKTLYVRPKTRTAD
jgi:acyl-coenzyme A thioesterase PaaI-like protein